jgi:hypothetical protein
LGARQQKRYFAILIEIEMKYIHLCAKLTGRLATICNIIDEVPLFYVQKSGRRRRHWLYGLHRSGAGTASAMRVNAGW